MPALALYLEPADVSVLLSSLNADEEIAFIVPDKRQLARIRDFDIALPELPERVTAGASMRTAKAAIAAFQAALAAAELEVPVLATASLTDIEQVRVFVEEERREQRYYPHGPRRWRAAKTLEAMPDGYYALWHASGGPLTIPAHNGEDVVIHDPWSGWAERRPGERHRPSLTGVTTIRLEVWTNSTGVGGMELDRELGRWVARWDRDESELRRSCFEWTGNDDGALDTRTSAATERWWRGLSQWTQAHGTAVPLVPGATEPGLFVWALPAASGAIARGKPHGY